MDGCLPRRPCLRYGTGCCLESIRSLKKEGTAMATTMVMEMALPQLPGAWGPRRGLRRKRRPEDGSSGVLVLSVNVNSDVQGSFSSSAAIQCPELQASCMKFLSQVGLRQGTTQESSALELFEPWGWCWGWGWVELRRQPPAPERECR